MPRSIREPIESIQGRRMSAARRIRTLAQDCSGAFMLEAVITVLVLSLVGTAVLSGLSTVHISGASTERQSTAENIARNQMEYVASLGYQDPPYSYPTVLVPAGYAVTSEAKEHVVSDTNIEKIVVTVSLGGTQQLVLETLRTK